MDKVRAELAGIVKDHIGHEDFTAVDCQAVADAVAKRVLEMQVAALRYDNQFGANLLRELQDASSKPITK